MGKEFLVKMMSNGANVSSARAINIVGAVASTVLVLYHGIVLKQLSAEIFGLYLAYCGGVYGVGKVLDNKQKESDANVSN